jgi:hypothetical protein
MMPRLAICELASEATPHTRSRQRMPRGRLLLRRAKTIECGNLHKVRDICGDR